MRESPLKCKTQHTAALSGFNLHSAGSTANNVLHLLYVDIHTQPGKRKRKKKDFPGENTSSQRGILLFPIDTAQGGIMVLLHTTCIMPNSSRCISAFPYSADLWFKAATGREASRPSGPWCYLWDFHTPVTLHFFRTKVETGTAEERTMWLSPNVVIPLTQTIMWSHHWH